MKPLLIYIDDEWPNLNQFKANFRQNYEILLADNAELGISLIKQYNPAVVLADQRLNESSGVEILDWCRGYDPDIVRMLVTGFNETRALVDAVNIGRIYHYIQKPWNLDQLSGTLARAVQFHQQQKLIKKQNADLFKLVDELERFVYSVSHDIRAPLMSVLGLIQLIRLEPEAATTYVDLMEQSVNRLDVFIRNIIDHYKNIRTDNAIKQVDLPQLVDLVVESHKQMSDASSVTVSTELVQQATLYSDEFRLNLILSNLLSNAIKYQRSTDEQRWVAITVHVDMNEAVFTVEDNGRGIAEKHMPSIFNIFYRISSDNAGSGLGLYLVKETVAKMNGSVEVSSQPGVGTRFTVKVPNTNA